MLDTILQKLDSVLFQQSLSCCCWIALRDKIQIPVLYFKGPLISSFGGLESTTHSIFQHNPEPYTLDFKPVQLAELSPCLAFPNKDLGTHGYLGTIVRILGAST